MEIPDIVPLIEQLDDNIEDLEEALGPLLEGALSDTAGKLPLLDKAHLYILVTYAIESILFSYLRLNGVNAKEHPVFRELIRVKQYFEKIKVAESAGISPSTKLDKAAAGRFIKHALAGNEKHDATIAQQQAVKRVASHTRFEEVSQTPKISDGKGRTSGGDALNDEADIPIPVTPKSETENATEVTSLEKGDSVSRKTMGKKRKSHSNGTDTVAETNASEDEAKRERKKRKKERKQIKLEEARKGQAEG